jgi:hypothetical protein
VLAAGYATTVLGELLESHTTGALVPAAIDSVTVTIIGLPVVV